MDLSDTLRARDTALGVIKSRSCSEGDFTLASGRKSRFYLDLKPTMLDPQGARALAVLALECIGGLDTKVDLVGGIAMGAVPLVAATVALSAETSTPVSGFFVRKEAKDHGTMKRIEAAGDLRGKNVVILEDVTTSGQSAMRAVEAAREAGANVVLVLSVVDRGEGAAEFFQRQQIRFRSLFRLAELQAGGA